MKRIFSFYFISFIFLEVVYHIACFGLTLTNPVFFLFLGVLFSGIATLLTGFSKKRVNVVFFWISLSVFFLMFASQLVYFKIFKQPLLIAAVTNAGQAALTNYWREALEGIIAASGYLVLLAAPLFVAGILLWNKVLVLERDENEGRKLVIAMSTTGFVGYLLLIFAGHFTGLESFEDYSEFYDPQYNIENFGVLASMQRDVLGALPRMEKEYLETLLEKESKPVITQEVRAEEHIASPEVPKEEKPEVVEAETVSENQVQGETGENVCPIDFEKLTALAGENKDILKLIDYVKAERPTSKNDYTGIFEGYNLIYLTAEGFSPYAVNEELTPTLYKMIHTGFDFTEYYVPLWQTSTSDGEYVNLTGLIPDQQFSMKRSAVNQMPFSLPAFFAKEGVSSYAYHNNTLSYYERHLSHPNLGYQFKASKIGDLDEAEWGQYVFQMENAKAWPSSDYDMMVATLPEYINQDRFHAYYMTVSGHMNYNFVGNQMSIKNKEAVSNLPYSEEGKAYIACNIELDKALAYLIEQLEAAGKLEKTVIVLSADHYPYAMNMANLEELAGMPLEGTQDIYRNNLILWNSEFANENGRIEVSKPCSALDLLPTIMNLFGFDYDSRMFAGKDIFSDAAPMVAFADRSFITDKISYNKKTKTTISLTEEDVNEEEVERCKERVRELNRFSSRVLQQDFYRYAAEAMQ